MLQGRTILYVTHRFPYPPAGGAKVRAFHCIARLARNNHVTVAAPLRDSAEAAAVEGLRRHGVEVLTAPIGPWRAAAQAMAGAALLRSASAGYFYAPQLAAAIRRFLKERPVDLAVVHASSVGHYLRGLRGVPKVMDFVDVDSRKWLDYSRHKPFPQSLVYALEGRGVAQMEVGLAQTFDLNLCATGFERDSLRELAGDVPVSVVRNGVDLDYFQPGDGEAVPGRICFTGRMDYYPNEQAVVAFCDEVLPRLRARHPEARFQIVGADPSRAVRALAGRPGVEVTGTVPDVRPYVKAAAVAVAPLQIARGTQNKLLEAMAMGVPVVTSPLAARGAEVTPGVHLLTGNGPEETAAHVTRLLDDPAARARLARAGRAQMEAAHSWSGVLDSFEAELEALLDRDAGAAAKRPSAARAALG